MSLLLSCNVIFIDTIIANCGHPGLVPRANDSLPRVEGYDDFPVRKGTNITFSCPPGKVLIGPNSATCTENGEWEPDLQLSDPMCKGIITVNSSYSITQIIIYLCIQV